MSRLPISSRRARRGLPIIVGGFVVTAGAEETRIAERFERANDDYGSILVKALADRIAEAFAESACTSACRKEFWGYASDETLSNEELIRRRLSRHSPGARLSGSARPHREGDAVPPARRRKREIGVKLTESFAMWPGSSVCGLYLAHPDAHYFGVAKIERDQVEDYARRKGWSVGEAERWLAPILNYEPSAYAAQVAAE